MAYDAARDKVVLFGGGTSYLENQFADTWTWDGTNWVQHTPTQSPSRRQRFGMAYDAARSVIVLFGGVTTHGEVGDTWTWNGTGTWTKHTPLHSPSPREVTGMAYDAARSEVVLFGGYNGRNLGDTWTWNGTGTWTKHTPVHSPSPRSEEGMAYDAARNEVVLFGGYGDSGALGTTWTWDGTDWTRQFPAHSPSPRCCMGMAYDAARSEVVLFGGAGRNGTWTWDSTDWTKLTPEHSPHQRCCMGMAYDAGRGQVVLFGGFPSLGPPDLADTWVWDGTDWTQRAPGSISLEPQSGAPGTAVQVQGFGFAPSEKVRLTFVDSTSGRTFLEGIQTDLTGAFTTQVTIPLPATLGRQHVKAKGLTSGEIAKRRFTVT
jgi:hypothetical protein